MAELGAIWFLDKEGVSAAKVNQARVDSQPHESLGFPSSAGLISAGDEPAEGQLSLPGIGSHSGILAGRGRPQYGVFTASVVG